MGLPHACCMSACAGVSLTEMFSVLPFLSAIVWGFIGKMEKIIHHGTSELRYYLFTHIEFDIKYNGDKVIEINVSTNPEQAVDISEDSSDLKVKFTYSVRWIPVATTWEKRLQRYERFPLNPVHLEVRGGRSVPCIKHENHVE